LPFLSIWEETSWYRKHIKRTDPIPDTDAPTLVYLGRQSNRSNKAGKPNILSNTNVIHPSEAVNRFLKMMSNCLTFQDVRGRQSIMSSIENAIDYLTNNFVILKRKDIAGISGHVCNYCLSFQYQFIKDIGFDLTAQERHRCISFMVNMANRLEDLKARQNHIRTQAVDHLLGLTNSLFIGNTNIFGKFTCTFDHLS
jgi:hypothetical protein